MPRLPRRLARSLSFALLACASLGPVAPHDARADALSASVGEGVTSQLDRATRALVVRSQETIVRVSIPEDAGAIADGAAVVTRRVAVADDRAVTHAVVALASKRPGAPPRAFELLAKDGASAPLYAGVTGLEDGEPGLRRGAVVEVRPRTATTSFVLLATVREELALCGGRRTLLDVRALDPKTMSFRSAAVQQLEAEERERATPLTAALAPAQAPLSRVAVAKGASSGDARALTDGDIETRWSEQRSGEGRGELAVLTTPRAVPLVALELVLRGLKAPRGAAAPATLFVASDGELFRVTLAEAAPGEAQRVVFPKPLATSCLAIVLDRARGEASHPDVGLAELTALTSFDDGKSTLADVAARLSAPDSDAARALLAHAGERGLAAVSEAFPTLTPPGKRLALDVAASSPSPCEGASGALLTMGLSDGDRSVRDSAESRLARCGRTAIPSLERALEAPSGPSRGRAALLLARVSPSRAVKALAAALGQGDDEERARLRSAFTKASGRVSAEELAPAIEQILTAPEAARLDLARALAPRAAELRSVMEPLTTTLWSADRSLARRYVLVPTALALGGALEREAFTDASWPVRARAFELGDASPELTARAPSAVRDPAPRVREAALGAVARHKLAVSPPSLAALVSADPFTFVRVAAAQALGAQRGGDDIDGALEAALASDRPLVRTAAAEGLAARGTARAVRGLLGALADDEASPALRTAAARGLASACAAEAADALTEAARHGASPVAAPGESALAVASLDALVTIGPKDLRERIAKLQKGDVSHAFRAAATQALAVRRPPCKR